MVFNAGRITYALIILEGFLEPTWAISNHDRTTLLLTPTDAIHFAIDSFYHSRFALEEFALGRQKTFGPMVGFIGLRHHRFTLKRELEPVALDIRFVGADSSLQYQIHYGQSVTLMVGGYLTGNWSNTVTADFLEFERGTSIITVSITDELIVQGKRAFSANFHDYAGGCEWVGRWQNDRNAIQLGMDLGRGKATTKVTGGTPTIESELLHDEHLSLTIVKVIGQWRPDCNEASGFIGGAEYRYLFYDESLFDERATQLRPLHDNFVLQWGPIFMLAQQWTVYAVGEWSSHLLLGEIPSLMGSYSVDEYDQWLAQIRLGVIF
jgi:hypothetical protein